MAKDPAFLFYTNDWLGGTMYMTFEQKGAYLELLLLQVSLGSFTEVQVKQVLNASFPAWEILREKFETDGKTFWNAKMKATLEKRRNFTESRKMNRLSKLVSDTSKTSVLLVGNGNGNGKEDIKKEPEPEILPPIPPHPLQAFCHTLSNVSKLKTQLSIAEAKTLEETYGLTKVKEVLLQMENKKDLTKKYVSVYLTCNNWCKMPSRKGDELPGRKGQIKDFYQ